MSNWHVWINIGRYPSEMRKEEQYKLLLRVHVLSHAPCMEEKRGERQE
jgi:hypothetical protein